MASLKRDSASYQVFMLALCVCTLIAMSANVLAQPGSETIRVLALVDTLLCAIFFLDFLLSLYRAENRWRYFYTWGWLDFLSSLPALDVARWGRVARILRIVRGVRAARMIGVAILERRAESTILAAALVALLLIVSTSVAMLTVETAPESNIKTAEDAIWWALTTITTVGYGDRYPVTPEGRIVAGILMAAGVGLVGVFSGFLAAWFLTPDAKHDRGEIEALRNEIAELRGLLIAMPDRAGVSAHRLDPKSSSSPPTL